MSDEAASKTSTRTPDELIAIADAAYRPFRAFAEWANLSIDRERWETYAVPFRDRRASAKPDQVTRAQTLIKQVAAIETGALENLYQLDRGFTITAATEVAAFTAALDKQQAEMRGYIESQLRAYDFVLDFATHSTPIAEAWIRELHNVICGEDATYLVKTAVGEQRQPLPRGQYKIQPNHVLLPNGDVHSYAPPSETAVEMGRFIRELQQRAFETAHPALQAAFAHYAFVYVHPFADGNGRVARALASVYTYRACSMPLLITTEHQSEYLSSLRAADAGDLQAFTTFVVDRGIDTMRLLTQTLEAAELPTVDDLTRQVRRLYVTTGGYSHEQVDKAGHDLFDLFARSIQERLDAVSLNIPKKSLNIQIVNQMYPIVVNGYRMPGSGAGRGLRIALVSGAPADVEVKREYHYELPTDAKPSDVVVIADSAVRFEYPVNELIKGRHIGAEIQLRLFVDRVVSEMLAEVLTRGAARKTEYGY